MKDVFSKEKAQSLYGCIIFTFSSKTREYFESSSSLQIDSDYSAIKTLW